MTLPDGLGGRRDVLLGKHGTKASRVEYARVIAEWESRGRCAPKPAPDLTITELIDLFMTWARTHYQTRDGSPTKEVNGFVWSLRPLNHLYGKAAAQTFGPTALQAVRALMIEGYQHPKYGPQVPLSRGVINMRVKRIRRMFKWGVANELMSPSVLHGLQAVHGLQLGRSKARETAPVLPVARAVVEATIAVMDLTLADMVRLQLATGMRPGELVAMRGCDIDMTGAVWLYRPPQHKTAHRGHERTVPIGPEGQAIVRRHLKTSTEAFLFSPAERMDERRADLRSKRQSPVQPSQVSRKKRRPGRKPGDSYNVCSYGKAVRYACDRAFPLSAHLQPTAGENGKRETKKAWWARLTDAEKAEVHAWRKEHRWHPHQLRHTRALELKREAGLDVARAVLGHRSPVITEHYATLDVARAAEVMGRIG